MCGIVLTLYKKPALDCRSTLAQNCETGCSKTCTASNVVERESERKNGARVRQERIECLRRTKRLLRHRGPDWSGEWVSSDGSVLVGHERLAIVCPQSGKQPIFALLPSNATAERNKSDKSKDCSESLTETCSTTTRKTTTPTTTTAAAASTASIEETPETTNISSRSPFDAFVSNDIGAKNREDENNLLVLVVNGEIYNCRELCVDTLKQSDCEAIVRAYVSSNGDAVATCRALDGDFAFALIDYSRRRCVVARDPMGVCPLYVATNANGDVCFASEMKAFTARHACSVSSSSCSRRCMPHLKSFDGEKGQENESEERCAGPSAALQTPLNESERCEKPTHDENHSGENCRDCDCERRCTGEDEKGVDLSTDGTAWSYIEQFRPGHVLSIPLDRDERNNTVAFDRNVVVHPKKGTSDHVRQCDERCPVQFEWIPYTNMYNAVPALMSVKDCSTVAPILAAARELRVSLVAAVRKRLMSDVPFGVLLSGGLDSSLVASITVHLMRTEPELAPKWGRLRTFSVGLVGSPDLACARRVADFLGTQHHEITFSADEGLASISDAVYYLETFDVTTLRAGTPMFLMARVIHSLGIKMVLSGEGADEALAGYAYFAHAPDGAALDAEVRRKLQRLHHFDVLRANKAMAAASVEVRVPFLDAAFLETALRVPAEMKLSTLAHAHWFVDRFRRDLKNIVTSSSSPTLGESDGEMLEKLLRRRAYSCEKWLLRLAFSPLLAGQSFLPKDILWRSKEQFSDGVGGEWIASIQRWAKEAYPDERVEKMQALCEHEPPLTAEACWMRDLFEHAFGAGAEQQHAVAVESGAAARAVRAERRTVACSTEIALEWRKEWAGRSEPSGHIES